MRRIAIAVLASGLALMHADKAVASEEQFLTSLEGKYEGKGQVRLRTNRGAPFDQRQPKPLSL